MYCLIKNNIMFGMGGEAFSSEMIAKSEDKEKLIKIIAGKLDEAIKNDAVECIDNLEKDEFIAECLDEPDEYTGHETELKILYKSDGFDRIQERYYIVTDENVAVI